MRLTTKMRMTCAGVIICSVAACAQPGDDFEVLDPICPRSDTREWILQNDVDFARQIIAHNRLIDKSCR